MSLMLLEEVVGMVEIAFSFFSSTLYNLRPSTINTTRLCASTCYYLHQHMMEASGIMLPCAIPRVQGLGCTHLQAAILDLTGFAT